MATDNAEVSTAAWWKGQRALFNAVLVAAIAVSVFCLVAARVFLEEHFPCEKVAAVSFLIIGVICLVGVAAANVCYFLGPVSEMLIRPRNVHAYRACLFWVGAVFSVLVASSLILSGTVSGLSTVLQVHVSKCD